MDTLDLGGNIQLTGFSDIDKGEMIILKKIIGNYARKFSDRSDKFEQLSVTMKPVHKTEASSIFEMHAKLIDNGKPIVGEHSDRNIFVATDAVLKKVEKGLNQ
jgi:ribosome-associated translation inhibitor RaiA